MGQQKQTKLPKNTHYFLLFPTFLPFRKKNCFLFGFFRHWFLHHSCSQLVSPLWSFIHEKPSCVISTYLFGCLGSKLNLSVLFWALNALFPLGILGGLLPTIIYFPFSLPDQNWRASLCSCYSHVQIAISSFRFISLPKTPFKTITFSLPFYWEVSPPSNKIPSQNCISKSPVKKSSVVPNNVCLGSALNHKLHESFPPLFRLYDLL